MDKNYIIETSDSKTNDTNLVSIMSIQDTVFKCNPEYAEQLKNDSNLMSQALSELHLTHQKNYAEKCKAETEQHANECKLAIEESHKKWEQIGAVGIDLFQTIQYGISEFKGIKERQMIREEQMKTKEENEKDSLRESPFENKVAL